MSQDEQERPMITERQVVLSFYITQTGLFILALSLLWWQGRLHWNLLGFDEQVFWYWGILSGMTVVAVDILLTRLLPESYFDDGGINELLIKNRPLWHIFTISLVAAFVEELFFRGAVQHWLGVWGTSLLFLLVHTRYLRQWIMITLVVLISLLFGWLVEWSGVLAPAIIAHATVDFVMGIYLRYWHD